MKATGMKRYDWLGREGAKNIFEWKVWYCHRRFSHVSGIIVLMFTNFLGGFFMINGLWVKPFHAISILRLILWFHLANITFAEGYIDVETWNTYERKENPV